MDPFFGVIWRMSAGYLSQHAFFCLQELAAESNPVTGLNFLDSNCLAPPTTAKMSIRQLLVDVHTHCYLPRYVNFLRQRTSVPRIFSRASEERLLILDDEPAGGRPVGPQVGMVTALFRLNMKQILFSIGRETKRSNLWCVWDGRLYCVV
jgi:hypothetical protein